MRTVLDQNEAVDIDPAVPALRRKWPYWVAAMAGFITLGTMLLLAHSWPFTQANVIHELEQATSSNVQVGIFRQTFFPHPGCVVEKVRFQRGTERTNQQLLTVEKLTIEATFTGLLTKHIARVFLEGARAMFPAIGTGPNWQPAESDITIDELSATEVPLDFIRHDAKRPPVEFIVHEFVGHHLATRDPMTFRLRLRNATPVGEISANGTFGPWKRDHLSETPLSGDYTFHDADLGVFGGIHGILASDGRFQGTLEDIAVDGTTATPDFRVDGSSNKVGLQSRFRAKVDSTNGDVTLEEVSAGVIRTKVLCRGNIVEREHSDGKTAALEFAVRQGRIQDLLLMFVSDRQAPLNGLISLDAKTVIPAGAKPFLRRLQLTGNFGIEDALFTRDKTQEDLDKLSAAARGDGAQKDDLDRAISDLRGHVLVRDGVATFSDLSFRIPGALAKLHGTFDLTTQGVDLKGILLMEARLPQATSGVKSFLLKAIDPFLKKNRRGGARIPVHITGTYQHPSYTADPV